MLEQVNLEDPSIVSFPQVMIEEIGSVEDITQSVVIVSSFAGKDDDMWIENLILGDNLISELQRRFTHAVGQDRNIVYSVTKVVGFLSDAELFKYGDLLFNN